MAETAKDIFGYDASAQSGFSEPGNDGVFMFNSSELTLVQQWQVQYQQNITPIYECGSSRVYFAAKHASGTLTIGRIVYGDESNLRTNIGTVCDPKEANLVARSGECATAAKKNKEVKLNFKGTILAGVGFSGQAQNSYINEDVTIQFAGLSVD